MKLSPEDISKHTIRKDETGESEDREDTEDEKPKKKQNVSQNRKMKTQPTGPVTTRSVTTQFLFQPYDVRKGVL